jgi:signal transduction histidine kinase
VIFWRSSIIARIWFLVIFFHSMVYIFWSLFSVFPDAINIDPRRFVQAATLLDAIFLAGVLAYTFRTEKSDRLVAQESSIDNLRMARDIEQAKSNFVSTVSHDLHGPVRAIGFFAESLNGKVQPEEQLAVQRITENVETVSALLNSIIKLSETDAKRQLVWEETSLSRIFYTLKNEFDPVARRKNLALYFEDVDCSIQTDSVSFSQVLRNLIENAIKYTSEGSVDILVEEYADVVSVSVSDTGRGIPQGKLTDVFDEFYQVSKLDDEGVGLGLSIVARLTRLLNIDVNVSSVVGRGSKFELRIPKLPLEQAEREVTQRGRQPMLNLIGTVISDYDPLFTNIVRQLQDWGVSMIEGARPVDKVDFVLVDGNAHGLRLAKDFGSNVWVLVFSEVDDFDLPDDRYVAISRDIAPMQLRAIMQRILKSVTR